MGDAWALTQHSLLEPCLVDRVSALLLDSKERGPESVPLLGVRSCSKFWWHKLMMVVVTMGSVREGGALSWDRAGDPLPVTSLKD